MKTIRNVKGIELNEGNLAAQGLYNLTYEDNVSFWFDDETKDELMLLNDADYIIQSLRIISQAN